MVLNYWDAKYLKEVSPTLMNKLKKLKTDRRKYCNGSIIHFEGDPIEAIGFVLNGMLKSSQYTSTGKEITTHYFYEGDMFPELMILSGIQHYSYNLVCAKNSEIDWMPLQSFQQLIRTEEEMMETLLKHISIRGYQNEIHLRCLHYHRMDERLAYYLLYNDQMKKDGWVYIPFSQKVLADQLNVCRSVLNQELITFESLGWIKREQDRIKILRPEKLKGIL